MLLGAALNKVGRRGQAITELELAIQFDPSSLPAYGVLADLHTGAARLKVMKRYLSFMPQSVREREALAKWDAVHSKTMKSQLDVVAHIQAAPGEAALVREVLESYVAPTRLENGCLRYDLFADVEDASKFTFIEEWTSAEALFQHSQSAHLAAGRARLEGKLAMPPQVVKLNRIV